MNKKLLTELEKYLKIASRAARVAGVFLSQDLRESKKVRADLGREVKIEADIQSERIIVDILKTKTSFPILTEESGMLDGDEKSGFFWVVDPLDGSLNFMRGIPVSCVSIALWKGDSPVLGVINDFNRKEIFKGIVGYGAWLNRESLSTSNVKEKHKAILFTGIPVKARKTKESAVRFMSNIKSFRKGRWVGSAALSLAYVASGRGDAYTEDGIMLWDVAAGLALVKAAGGRYSLERSKNNRCSVYASNKYLLKK